VASAYTGAFAVDQRLQQLIADNDRAAISTVGRLLEQRCNRETKSV
jgi:hypothetical protein